MANHYVIIDGHLQRSSPETKRWTRRAGAATPLSGEPEPEPVVDLTDRRSDFEIISDLDETPDL